MAKQSTLSKTAHVGGGLVVGGGIAYGLYELVLWIQWKRYKVKNPTSTITFADYKKNKPV
jgi:hypothetical protein